MGTEVGPWEGLYTAISDTLWETAGYLLVRSTANYTAGDATLTVESTDRFLPAGRIAFQGKIADYTGLTATSFTGLTDRYTGGAGVDADMGSGSVVMDWSQLTTQLDGLRASFLLPYAEGEELDILARNYGIARVRGLSDTVFRALLEAWIYLEAQTIYGCEQILDALVGPGLYTLYEDLEGFHHTVFVLIPPFAPTSFRGKAFLCGGELHTRDTFTTVTVDHAVATVYGVWDETDTNRDGTNYAELSIAATTAAANPDRLGSAALWLAGDVGKSVILDGTSHWQVAAFLSTSSVRLSGTPQTDGSVVTGSPDELATGTDWWTAWMLGHKVTITSTVGTNAGTYVIAEVINRYTVRLTGAVFTTETDVSWVLIPNFANGTLTARILRATAAGAVVTTPVNMPATVLVDYTAIPSAQLIPDSTLSGNEQYAYYLWDDTYIAQTILDLITAAGVRVVITVE